MNRYRVEILGRTPNGLTDNDVFASVNSMTRECEDLTVESVSRRRLRGGMLSIVAVFEAKDIYVAQTRMTDIGRGVTNFSFDLMVREGK